MIVGSDSKVHIGIKIGGSIGNGRATQPQAALEKQQIDMSNSARITRSLVQEGVN
jgi:hypothetical protein